jgi:crotonobetainyl-CoA:carnitine CoA-transferase CaiB-like acyl-CoA transferase
VRLPASEAVTPPPPLAGQHTADVLAQVLGLSKDDVKELQQRGVVG